MTTAQLLAEQATGIGGSEIAALFDADPWSDRFTLYQKKIGELEAVEATYQMEKGTQLEPLILRTLEAEKGVVVVPSPPVARHADCEQVLAHADGLIQNGNGLAAIVEAKYVSFYQREHWGDIEANAAPDKYLLQVWQEIGCYGAPGGYLAADIEGERGIKIYWIERDKGVEAKICEVVDDFWRNHVLKRVPPPIDGSAGARQYLLDTFPRAEVSEVEADDLDMKAAFDYERVRLAIKELQGEQSVYKHQLQAKMKEAQKLVGDGWRANWSRFDKKKTDWKMIATVASEFVPEMVYEKLVEEHTKASAGDQFRILGEVPEPPCVDPDFEVVDEEEDSDAHRL